MRYGAALLTLLAVVGYVTFRTLTGAATECTVEANGERVALQPEQAANATTIGAVASSRDLPERALAIALATAMQESGLRNLRDGDRDSLGLFQQRPSQGWGTAQQIVDPVYSANEFFDQLVKIPGYADLPLTVAAQRVQHSGYPQAYAKREGDASVLASALSGRVPSLTCRVVPDEGAGNAAAVRAQLAREFGQQALPQQDASQASVDVPVVAPGAGASAGQASQHGWVLAQWAVAHAQALRIAEVSYAGRVWRASHSGKGWVEDPAADAPGRPGASGQPYEDVRIAVAR